MILPVGSWACPETSWRTADESGWLKDTWKKQLLYCKVIWMLWLFIEGFVWIRVSAFWTAKCHHSGRPHWRPLNALFCACSPARLASACFWVPDRDMRSQDGEKSLPLFTEGCGHFYPSKQTSTQHFASLRGQWFPSQRRKSHKGSS